MTNLAFTVLARGEGEQARVTFVDSFAFGREHGDRFNAVACLRGFGAVALAAGHPERAVPYFALGDALFTATGATHWPAERLGGPIAIEDLRTRLGDKAFAAAWAIGQAWSLEAATAEAMTGWPPTPTSLPDSLAATSGGLCDTERCRIAPVRQGARRCRPASDCCTSGRVR
jgi:hypothetical protein